MFLFSVTIMFNRRLCIYIRLEIDFEIKTYKNSLFGSATMLTILNYIDYRQCFNIR